MEEKDPTDELSQYSGEVKICCEQEKVDSDSQSCIFWLIVGRGRSKSMVLVDGDHHGNGYVTPIFYCL